MCGSVQQQAHSCLLDWQSAACSGVRPRQQPADSCFGLVSAAPRRRDLSGQVEDAEVIEEVMLAALHMFKVGGAGADTRVLHHLQ